MEIAAVKDLESKLEAYLKNNHSFTLNDAVAATGLSYNDARIAMEILMLKYHCVLQVTETGDMLYNFGKFLWRRSRISLKEYWRAFTKFIWKAFVALFKIWITLMLVVYFFVFVALIILMVISAADSKNKKNNNSDGFFEIIGKLFKSLFHPDDKGNPIVFEKDEHGYSFRRYNDPEPIIKMKSKKNNKTKEPQKRFVSCVYDFVFGPPRIEEDPLTDQKEVASFLRKRNGYIVMSEMKILAGLSEQEVQKFFSDIIVRFNGDAKVSDDGIIFGDFEHMTKSLSAKDDAKIVYYWDEYEPPYLFTGNTWKKNLQVFLMNLLIIASSIGFMYLFHNEVTYGDYYFNQFFIDYPFLHTKWALILLGYVPLLFSILFFIVPAIRFFTLIPKRKRRYRENIRRRLMKILYSEKGWDFSIQTLMDKVNEQNDGIEKLKNNVVEETMKQLVRDWDGQVEMRDDGVLRYVFPRLNNELSLISKLRKQRNIDNTPEDIIMSTQS